MTQYYKEISCYATETGINYGRNDKILHCSNIKVILDPHPFYLVVKGSKIVGHPQNEEMSANLFLSWFPYWILPKTV